MAKRKEENEEWKASTKFFGKKAIVRTCISNPETIVSEKNGVQVVKTAEFVNITKNDGYVPRTKEEEEHLLKLSQNPSSYIIELSNMPKSADARKAETDNINLRNEMREKDMELERLRAIVSGAGLNTDKE